MPPSNLETTFPLMLNLREALGDKLITADILLVCPLSKEEVASVPRRKIEGWLRIELNPKLLGPL